METLESDELFNAGENFSASAWLETKTHVTAFPELYTDLNGGIDSTKLELDKTYDVAELGIQGGVIDIFVSFADLDTSYERGAEALLQIKETLDTNGIGFYYINFGVYNSEGNYAIIINNFSYKDIYKEGLAERIQKSHETISEHYNK